MRGKGNKGNQLEKRLVRYVCQYSVGFSVLHFVLQMGSELLMNLFMMDIATRLGGQNSVAGKEMLLVCSGRIVAELAVAVARGSKRGPFANTSALRFFSI